MPKKGHKFYSVSLKDGKRRRRVHDAKTGRIIKWEDAIDLDEPTGEYRILEYILNYKATKGNNIIPYEWEVRVRLPEGYTDIEIEREADQILMDLTNEGMVETAEMSFTKKGIDFIEYSEDDNIKWKVVCSTAPQYHYPRKGWGEINEDR